MIARATRIYLLALIGAEATLLTSFVLVHLLVVAGNDSIYEVYHGVLMRAVLVVGIPTIGFKSRSVGFLTQIRSCPKWMWRTAVGIAMYGMLTFALLFSPMDERHLSAWVGSAFPLGFEAVPICILYSALSASRNEETWIIERARVSVLFLILGFLWVLYGGRGITAH